MIRSEVIGIMAAIIWARREGTHPTTAVVDAETLLGFAELRESKRRAELRGDFPEPGPGEE